jgi:hypothetical protein
MCDAAANLAKLQSTERSSASSGGRSGDSDSPHGDFAPKAQHGLGKDKYRENGPF